MNDSPTSVNTAGCNPSEAILHNLQCEPDLVHGLGIVLMVHRCHRLGDIGASDISRLDSFVAVAELEPAACWGSPLGNLCLPWGGEYLLCFTLRYQHPEQDTKQCSHDYVLLLRLRERKMIEYCKVLGTTVTLKHYQMRWGDCAPNGRSKVDCAFSYP